jgi:hypothetical protein
VNILAENIMENQTNIIFIGYRYQGKLKEEGVGWGSER